MALASCKRAADGLTTLGVRLDTESEAQAWSATVQLAAGHGLTIYDACYLELARRRRLPLATLDTGLARAARKVGVEALP